MADVITKVDDLDGKTTEGVTPHTFSLDGSEYVIDLSPANVEKLSKALKPFMEAGRGSRSARTVNTFPKAGKATGKRVSNYDADAARGAKLYFTEHPDQLPDGEKLGDRGRVSSKVTDAWKALGSPTP